MLGARPFWGLVDVDDLVEVGLDVGKLGCGTHVEIRLRICHHRFKVCLAAPLRVIGDMGPVQALVNVRAMNTIVNNLEEAGLLVRRPHPEHGRVLQAYVTPEGENLLQEGHRRVRAIEERMVASLQHDQQLHLVKALQACADALEKNIVETSVPL